MKTNMTVKTALFLFAAGVSLWATSSPARAQDADDEEVRSPLADAPAVRRRVELRHLRFELGPTVGASLAQDFYHAVTVGGRAGFHLTDYLGIGVVGGFNVSPNWETGFNRRLVETLPTQPLPDDRAPTQQVAQDSMNRIGWFVAPQVEFSPFVGKFAMFGRIFMNYDFYIFGGPGLLNLQADAPACDNTPRAEACAVVGTRFGANVGLGLHAFFNQFIAFNAELRNLLVRNNPGGRDVNFDGVINDNDLRWDSNFIVTLGATFFFPSRAEISP